MWTFFPLFIQNETIVGRYGDASLTDVFPLAKESFPIGPVIHNFVNLTKVKYFYNTSLSAHLKMYYFRNENHYLNRVFSNNNFRLEVGINLLFSKGIFNY
ncbi:MAG: hypothetical protein KAS18_07620 [Calditrichia bacterium]|nr:hypothetical protein [Calditrichia bacterium]